MFYTVFLCIEREFGCKDQLCCCRVSPRTGILWGTLGRTFFFHFCGLHQPGSFPPFSFSCIGGFMISLRIAEMLHFLFSIFSKGLGPLAVSVSALRFPTWLFRTISFFVLKAFPAGVSVVVHVRGPADSFRCMPLCVINSPHSRKQMVLQKLWMCVLLRPNEMVIRGKGRKATSCVAMTDIRCS